MKREAIYQHVLQYLAPDERDDQKMRALYAYAVKRKFPSPEVLFNKAYELATGMDAESGMFASQGENIRAQFTALRAVTEALEALADEPIEAFDVELNSTGTADAQTGAKPQTLAADAGTNGAAGGAAGAADIPAKPDATNANGYSEPLAGDAGTGNQPDNSAPPLSGEPLAGTTSATETQPAKSKK